MNAAIATMSERNRGRRAMNGRKIVAMMAAGSLLQAAGCDIGRGIGNLFGSVIVGVTEVVEDAGIVPGFEDV